MESTTKKKFGAAVGGVAAVGAAISLTAGTFSYFTDTDTSPEQTVTTGHISIGHTVTDAFPNVKWSPGTSYTEYYTLKNTGSVSGDLTVRLANAGGNTSLRNALQVQVDSNAPGTLKEVEDYGDYDAGTLGAGDTKTFKITVSLPDNGKNQNGLQDKSASAKVVATLQTTP